MSFYGFYLRTEVPRYWYTLLYFLIIKVSLPLLGLFGFLIYGIACMIVGTAVFVIKGVPWLIRHYWRELMKKYFIKK